MRGVATLALVFSAMAGAQARGGRGGGGGRGAASNAAPAGAAALEAMKPDSLFLESVPPDQRASREELIKSANSYFDAIEKADDKVGAFDPDCTRFENGAKVTILG